MQPSTAIHLDPSPREITIDLGETLLRGDAALPDRAFGWVVFAHGSGSGRHSPRNRMVAARLREEGIGTLLFDLLTLQEEKVDAFTGSLRFDMGLLARRLAGVLDWVAETPRIQHLPLGLFGASTGAGAALMAAATRPERVAALVSRGGRPDLADEALDQVRAPTLLIVGGRDPEVIALNRQAFDRLTCEKILKIVPGATHLFEEPGTLEVAADLATAWFSRHFKPGRT